MLSEDEYYCVGEETEVKNYKRKLCFDADDDKEIVGKYNLLIPEYQNIVRAVLYELPDGDFFGFNLKRFLEGYKHAEPKVSQYKISGAIDGATQIEGVVQTVKDIDKQIDAAKQRGSLRNGDGSSAIEQYIKCLCDYFLIRDDLLKKGMGMVYVIKDNWYERFINDIRNSPFSKQMNSKPCLSYNTLQYIREYEKFLYSIKELKTDESILEEKWAVMTYSGAYQLLKKEKNRRNEQKAIDRLIGELYVRQLLDGKMPTIENHI
jgi:hypothetical protein